MAILSKGLFHPLEALKTQILPKIWWHHSCGFTLRRKVRPRKQAGLWKAENPPVSAFQKLTGLIVGWGAGELKVRRRATCLPGGPEDISVLVAEEVTCIGHRVGEDPWLRGSAGSLPLFR